MQETTALAAQFLAGLAVGFWQDRSELSALWSVERSFDPNLPVEERAQTQGMAESVHYQVN